MEQIKLLADTRMLVFKLKADKAIGYYLSDKLVDVGEILSLNQQYIPISPLDLAQVRQFFITANIDIYPAVYDYEWLGKADKYQVVILRPTKYFNIIDSFDQVERMYNKYVSPIKTNYIEIQPSENDVLIGGVMGSYQNLAWLDMLVEF